MARSQSDVMKFVRAILGHHGQGTTVLAENPDALALVDEFVDDCAIEGVARSDFTAWSLAWVLECDCLPFAMWVRCWVAKHHALPPIGEIEPVWFIDGKGRPHCENGPAEVQSNGHYAWWWHGAPHREDGPACGDEWFVDGYAVDADEWLSFQHDAALPSRANWSDEQLAHFRLWVSGERHEMAA